MIEAAKAQYAREETERERVIIHKFLRDFTNCRLEKVAPQVMNLEAEEDGDRTLVLISPNEVVDGRFKMILFLIKVKDLWVVWIPYILNVTLY